MARRYFAGARVQKLERVLFWCLATSRIAIFILQVLGNLLPDHDADAQKPLNSRSSEGSFINSLFEGFHRWDSVHYLLIAQHGYVMETSLAYFPLFPMMVRFCCGAMQAMCYVPITMVNIENLQLITATMLNSVCFILAGLVLFRLSLRIHKDVELAFISTILFAINPASIFFSAAYSESLFCFLTFLGLYFLSRGQNELQSVIESSICFGLALITRSNGILNFGFILFVLASGFARHFLENSKLKKGLRTLWCTKLLSYILVGSLALIVFILPFLYHHFYLYQSFCSGSSKTSFVPAEVRNLAASNPELVLVTDRSKHGWCKHTLPLSYPYVQGKNWDVGLFGYYQLRKIPLFLLAVPVLVLSYLSAMHFLMRLGFSNGLVQVLAEEGSTLPFIVHLVVLCVMGLLIANVEITTRLVFSSNPLILWYCASLFLPSDSPELLKQLESVNLWSFVKYLWRRSKTNGMVRFVLCYFLCYAVVGTLLHVNFLPWT